jgi:thioredoxin reductase (NADPH)
LEKVTHYFREAHPYAGMKTAIIGGSNSAVDAAMELIRVGAEVTMVYRGEEVSQNIKPWVRPLFDSMVQKGHIQLHLNSRVVQIAESSITVLSNQGQETIIENDFVLALTGFRPDRKLLASPALNWMKTWRSRSIIRIRWRPMFRDSMSLVSLHPVVMPMRCLLSQGDYTVV